MPLTLKFIYFCPIVQIEASFWYHLMEFDIRDEHGNLIFWLVKAIALSAMQIGFVASICYCKWTVFDFKYFFRYLSGLHECHSHRKTSDHPHSIVIHRNPILTKKLVKISLLKFCQIRLCRYERDICKDFSGNFQTYLGN